MSSADILSRLLSAHEAEKSVEEIGEGKVSNFALDPGDIVYVPERVV